MKVLAVNSSPRTGGQSKTEMILDLLTTGMKEEGADVEIINIHKKKINYCIGCFTCWTKTPGRCVHQDDMSHELFPKYMASDLCILATPLYHYTVNANLKAFIERTLPMAQPFFELKHGITRHPLRQAPPRVAVLSVAGFPEHSVFDQLSAYMKFLFGKTLVAEIYIPAAETLSLKPNAPLIRSVLDAVTQGGRELVKHKALTENTARAIHTPTIDAKIMSLLGNIFWQTCIDEGITPREFEKLRLMPRPNSLESFLAVMKTGFNPEKADGIKAGFQFVFSGTKEGTCHLIIDAKQIQCNPGPLQNPDVTIISPFEVWMDILTRKAEGAQLFMEGKYRVEGDLNLLMKMGELFR